MLIHVPLNQIDDNPYQRRADYGDVESLAADIRTRGLLQVPRGRLIFGGGVPVEAHHYQHATGDVISGHPDVRVQLAFGHRRLRAYRHLAEANGGSWTAMPVYVEALTDDQMLDAVWSENQHRSDINPIEQAELLAEKLDRVRLAGGSQTTLATEWGLDRSTIANKLRLLDLPPDVQAAVRDRRLSERQATALLPVVELAQRVNGQPIAWRDGAKHEPYNTPIAPAAFTTYAVAHPDKVTSDTIRDYTRAALAVSGRLLPDTIAKFDAGPADPPIVQPLCAGCPYRHNQHCLNRHCLDAKNERFQAQIPQLATAHTGLPWHADTAVVPRDRDEGRALRDAYLDLSQHDSLVITWFKFGWAESWFDGPTGYRSPEEIANDWRKGLALGRAPHATAAAIHITRPPRETWTRLRAHYRNQRKELVRGAFAQALTPLAQQPDALRALTCLIFNRGRDTNQVTPDEMIQRLTHYALGNIYTSDTDELRHFLESAGLPSALADFDDPLDRLRERAAQTLDDWYNHRDAAHNCRNQAAAAVRRLANHFAGYGIVGISPDDESQPEDLRELAHWLAIALAEIEAQPQTTPEAS